MPIVLRDKCIVCDCYQTFNRKICFCDACSISGCKYTQGYNIQIDSSKDRNNNKKESYNKCNINVYNN